MDAWMDYDKEQHPSKYTRVDISLLVVSFVIQSIKLLEKGSAHSSHLGGPKNQGCPGNFCVSAAAVKKEMLSLQTLRQCALTIKSTSARNSRCCTSFVVRQYSSSPTRT